MNRIDWHRLFGLVLTDFFTDSPFVVELERDLSVKRQRLDVIVLRKRPGAFVGRLPDGFDNLTTHNLITFKSHQEALDDWALKELTGHYVNYRKQVSPSFDNLLPEDQFRLYAVCSRFPQNLAASADWKPLQEGVFEYRRGSDLIRVVVLRQLPDTEPNSVLHLLSAVPEKVKYGASHYQQHSNEMSSLLNRLFRGYQREGIAMPYTMADLRREEMEDRLEEMTPEERQKLFEKLPPQAQQKLLENLVGNLSIHVLLKGRSPEEIESYLGRSKKESVSPKRKKKK